MVVVVSSSYVVAPKKQGSRKILLDKAYKDFFYICWRVTKNSNSAMTAATVANTFLCPLFVPGSSIVVVVVVVFVGPYT